MRVKYLNPEYITVWKGKLEIQHCNYSENVHSCFSQNVEKLNESSQASESKIKDDPLKSLKCFVIWSNGI